MDNEEVMAQARAIADEVAAAGFDRPPRMVRVSGSWYRIDSLDAAWAEAEAALPEGWRLDMLRTLRLPTRRDPLWQAVAVYADDGRPVASGEGPTPAAALRALAARLREAKG